MRDLSDDDGGEDLRHMVQMREGPPRYHSYLLRCWQEEGVVKSRRFMLENPHTGKRLGFSNCEALLAFIKSELNEGATPAKERRT